MTKDKKSGNTKQDLIRELGELMKFVNEVTGKILFSQEDEQGKCSDCRWKGRCVDVNFKDGCDEFERE